MMKTKMVVSALIMAISMWSAADASDGTKRHASGHARSQNELLTELPANKEMLFHQTMRGAREKASEIRKQIKALRRDMKDILTAEQFDEDLFREKADTLEALRNKIRATTKEAVVILAKQFTAEERKILAELFPRRPGRGGHASQHRRQ